MLFKWKFGKSSRARKQFKPRKPLHEPLEQRQLLTVVAHPGDPYLADEGSTIQLSGAASQGAITSYSWDLDGDGVYGDDYGVSVDFSAADNGVYTVGLEVTDGTDTQTATTTVTVANVSPTVGISVQHTDVVRGENVTFTLSASDPSSVDQGAGFTFEVDWDGSGTFESFTLLSGQQVKRRFWDLGLQTVHVKATDKDGGTSSIQPLTIDVHEHLIRDNKAWWGGTQGVDEVRFIEDGGQLRAELVTVNGVSVNQQIVLAEAIHNIDHIRADGFGGDDVFEHSSGNARYEFHGGNENDILIGGSQSDSLYGGEHNDYLEEGPDGNDLGDYLDGGEGSGRDTIVGGTGDDTMYSGKDDDLFIITDHGDDLEVDGAEGNDRLEFTTGNGADTLDFNSYTGEAHMSRIVNLNSGSMKFGRLETIDIETGDGDDQITLRDDALIASFELDAGIGNDSLFLALDSDATSSQVLEIDEDAFSITNTIGTDLVTIAGTYAGFEQLEVDGSSFGDELTLMGNTSAAFVGLTSAKLRGGGGGDILNASFEYLPAVVTLDGEEDNDDYGTNGGEVTISDSGTIGEDTWSLLLTEQSNGDQTVTVRENSVEVSNSHLQISNTVTPYSDLEKITVLGSLNNDTMTVEGLESGSWNGAGTVELFGGAGDDTLNASYEYLPVVKLYGQEDGDSFGTNGAEVLVDGGAGVDNWTLNLTDPGHGGQNVKVKNSTVEVMNTELTPVEISMYDSLDMITVLGSLNNDTMTVEGLESGSWNGAGTVELFGGAGDDTLNASYEYLPVVKLYGQEDDDSFGTNGAEVLVDGGAGIDKWTLNLTDPGHGGQNVKVKNSTVEVMNTELTPVEISMYDSLDMITVLGSLNNDTMTVEGLESGSWNGAGTVELFGGAGDDTLNASYEYLPVVKLYGQEDDDSFGTNGAEVLVDGGAGVDDWTLNLTDPGHGGQNVKVKNSTVEVMNTELTPVEISMYDSLDMITVLGSLNNDTMTVEGLESGPWNGAGTVELFGGAGDDTLNASYEYLPVVKLYGQEDDDSFGTNGAEVLVDGGAGVDDWTLNLTDPGHGGQNVKVKNSTVEVMNTELTPVEISMYDSLDMITVLGSLNNDTMTVEGLESGPWNGAGTVELFGRAGNDTLNASYEYLPVVKLYGEEDDDSFGTNGAEVLVDGGSTGVDEWTLNLTDPGHGSQDVKVKDMMVEVMNTELTPADVSTYVSLDKITVLGSTNSDTMTIEGAHPSFWDGADTVVLEGGGGSDELVTQPGAMPDQVELVGGSGSDLFRTFGLHATINGGIGDEDSWIVELDDLAHGGQVVNVSNSEVNVLNFDPYLIVPQPFVSSPYSEVEQLTVVGSVHNDTLQLIGLETGAWEGADKVELFGGDGNDTLNVYPEILPTSIELYGEGGDDTFTADASSATIHGGAGQDTLWVLTEQGAVQDNIVVDTARVRNGLTSVEQSYTSIETLNVETFGETDLVTVETTDSNPYLPATISINAGSGSDTIRVIGTSDDDRFIVSGNTITTSRSVSITGLNHEGQEVHGGTGNDLFRVQAPQDLTYAILVKGEAGVDTLDMSRSALDETDALYPQVQIDEIEILDLSHNEYQTVPTLQASTIADLTSLDLKYNKLDLSDPVELDPLQTFTALTRLNLHGNTIPVGSVPDLEGIKGMLLRVDLAPVGLDKAEQEDDAEDAFAAIAKALHYSPLAIYEYVVNQFEIEFYEGLMKGPLATVQTKAGNAWDQSNLLIELLDEVGIASNLVSIQRDGPAPGGVLGVSEDTVQDWVGASNLNGAVSILTSSGLYAGYDQARGRHYFDHAWVSADFGSVGGTSSAQLDPSWKFKDYSTGAAEYLESVGATSIGELVPYDSDPSTGEYFSQERTELTYEWYEKQVAQYLIDNNTGLSLADLRRDGPIKPQHFDSLPSWPDNYEYLTGPDPVSGTIYTSFTDAVQAGLIIANPSIPLEHTHRIQLTLAIAADKDDPENYPEQLLWTTTLKIPEVSLQPLVVREVGSKIGLYIGDNPNAVAEGLPNSSRNTILTVGLIRPGETAPVSTKTHSYSRLQGQVMAIGVAANQFSVDYLSGLQSDLNEAVLDAISHDDISRFDQADMGSMLALEAALYYWRKQIGDRALDGIFQTRTTQQNVQSGLVSANPVMTFEHNFNEDIQIPFVPDNLYIDLGQATVGASSIHGDAADETARKAVALDNTSAQEHAIWEEFTNAPAMSTVRSFQLARSTTPTPIPIANLTSWTGTQVTDLDPSIRARLEELFLTGTVSSISVPEKHTNTGNFTGVGYVVNFVNGTKLYEIKPLSGGPLSGGVATAGAQAVAAATRSALTRIVGDPVDIATGGVTEEVVDIDIPNIGLGLSFSRYYDSASADLLGNVVSDYDAAGDQTIGRGWWHSYSDRLISVKEAGTETITYYSNRGHKYEWTYDISGGQPSLQSSPEDFYGDVTYDANDPTHTFNQVRFKDGTNRRFQMVSGGGSTLYGYLVNVIDKHGNQLIVSRDASQGFRIVQVYDPAFTSTPQPRTLTFSYDANGNLHKITDFTGREWDYTVTSDASGEFLTQVASPTPAVGGQPVFQYSYYTDASVLNTRLLGKLKDVVRPDGGVIHHTYYPNGRAFQAVDSEGYVQTFSFDLYRKRTWFTDERGNDTVYTYNSEGQLIELTYPDRATETYAWQDGVETERVDPYGTRVVLDYSPDIYKNLVSQKVQGKLPDGTPVELETTYVYQDEQYTSSAGYTHILSNLFVITQPSESGEPLRQTEYHHSTVGNPAELTAIVVGANDPNLRYTTFFHYDGNTQGLVQRQIDPRLGNHVTTFTYNVAGQVTNTETWVEDAPLLEDQFIEEGFDYDDRGYLISRTDGKGNTTIFENDILGRQTKMILPAINGESESERTWIYRYDASGQRVEVDHPDLLDDQQQLVDERIEEFDYDKRGRLVRTVYQDGTESGSVYDQAGNAVYVTDQLGRVTESIYDSRNRPVRTVLPDHNSVWQAFDGKGRLRQSTDQLGRSTTFRYDFRDLLLKQTDPDPDGPGEKNESVWTYEYDAVGNMITEVDPRLGITRYKYDVLSRLVELTERDPDGTGDLPAPVWKYEYDAVNNQTKVTDPLLRETISEYDGVSRVVETRIEEGGVVKTKSTFGYDKASNLVAVVDPRAYVEVNGQLPDPALYTTTFGYNARNLQDSIDRPNTSSNSTTQYDNFGRVTADVDELNRAVAYSYDILDRVIAITDPTGDQSHTEYDDLGRVTATIDALGHRTEYLYDVLGRDVGMIDAQGNRTTREYDVVGNLLSITDANGNVTRYTYDNLNRLIAEEQVGLPGQQTYDYDENSNLTRSTNREDQTILYEYDHLDRLFAEKFTDGISSTPVIDFEYVYSYDAAGQLKTVEEFPGDRTQTTATSNITYDYDYAGRTTSVDTNHGPSFPPTTLIYTYDNAGNLRTLTDQESGVSRTQLVYSYDNGGRLASIAVQDLAQVNDETRQTISFYYNDADERESILRVNNIPAQDTFQAFTVYAYDGDGLLDEMAHFENPIDGDLLFHNDLTRDELGRVTDVLFNVAGSLREFSYEYDPLGQLLEANQRGTANIEEQYDYDALGNRIDDDYQLPVHNRILEDELYTYEYDADGNLKTATEKVISPGAAYRREIKFNWDHRGRLTDSDIYDAATAEIEQEITYQYDAFDRRILKDVDGVQQRYVYDGDQVLLQYDETNTRTHRYVYGTGIDELLLVETPDDFFWTLDDYLGSIRHARNEDGSEGFTREYDSFGNITEETQFDAQNPVDVIFGYTGREFDEETGLQYNRARYYNPGTGRFISNDPSGFAGGDANLYRYVGNSPIIFVDPSGLSGVYSQPSSSRYTSPQGSGGQYNAAPTGGMTFYTSNPTTNAGEINVGISSYNPEQMIVDRVNLATLGYKPNTSSGVPSNPTGVPYNPILTTPQQAEIATLQDEGVVVIGVPPSQASTLAYETQLYASHDGGIGDSAYIGLYQFNKSMNRTIGLGDSPPGLSAVNPNIANMTFKEDILTFGSTFIGGAGPGLSQLSAARKAYQAKRAAKSAYKMTDLTDAEIQAYKDFVDDARGIFREGKFPDPDDYDPPPPPDDGYDGWLPPGDRYDP